MESANIRIAKNTMYMYLRLFVVLFLGLYSSRIVLQVLGVSDYGLYTVVGGVLAMFHFISASFSSTTSRFLNAEMGKPEGNVNRIFNVNVTLQTFLALTIFILAETVGLWYIYNKLSVAPNKMSDAVFIYQIAIITSCTSILNVPYYSMLSSHERFKFLAKLDIFNTILRFCCIVSLQFYEGEYALRLYAMIMCLTTANTFIVCHLVAVRNWPEIVRLRIVKCWSHYKEILSFINWNLLSTISTMARDTGSDLIINIFYGTAMNGAFAIGKNVNQNVSDFSNKFDLTSAPQIIQSYAAKDMERCTYLANKLGRINLLLFLWILFPLFIELDFLLHLWLGEVPEGALGFTQLNLIIVGCMMSTGGINNVINASGKIKWFKIQMAVLFLLCLPIGYVMLKLGFPPYTMLVLFIIADITQCIIQLILAHHIIHFDSLRFIKEAYIRPCLIIVIMTTLLYMYSFVSIDHSVMKILAIIVCFIINTSLIYIIGMKSGERESLNSFVKTKIGMLVK